MRSLSKRTVAVWLVIVWMGMFAAAFATEGSAGILYKVQNKGTTVYLLGSIHVGNEEMYPFGETIQQAMEASDIFAFECDTTSVDAFQATLKWMYYADQTRVQDVISESLYQKLEAVCAQKKISIKLYEKMRPWAIMTQFAMEVTATEMGVQNELESVQLGVEAKVKAFADGHQKEVQYLETTEGQLSVFERMGMPLQEYLLDETLSAVLNPEDITGMDATMQSWPLWWYEGNISAFVDSYRASYLSDENAEINAQTAELLGEYHRILVSERNVTMTDMVEEYLQGDGNQNYFITVGLLHLVLPEDSIPTLLRERGYTVECVSLP